MEYVKTPWHLWVTGVLAVLWNGGGVFDYLMTVTENEAYLSQFTPEQLAYFQSFPVWVTAAWATAVWSAFLGSILLLIRSKWAEYLFWISLIAMLLTAIDNYLLSDVSMLELMGPFALVFSALIVVITIALVIYAHAMRKRGVLR